MRLLENKKGVVDFILYKNEEVLVYNDKIKIGDKMLPINEKAYFDCVKDVLYKQTDDKGDIAILSRYDGNAFVKENFRYEFKKYFSSQQFTSIDSNDGNVKISFIDKGNESLIEFVSEDDYFVLTYDIPNEILILNAWYDDGLLFYTKTGERLWEYKVEEGREIHENAVVVVDDIVVITCKNGKNKIVSVEGYKLLTGEKIWEADDVEHCRKSYSLGQNKMLYGLTSFICKDHMVEMRLTQLNPFTGEVDMKVINEGEYWSEVWPWNTTIHGNKLFYTNLIEAQGCSLGVIDLETKELIEDFPMEAKGYQIDKPIVTDDKIYVRVIGLNELRIYENEFK